MENETMQIYTARVTQANRSELVVIMYEIVIADIKEAINANKTGNIGLFDKKLKRAQKLVSELIATLDFSYVISLDLMQLYLYVNKRIIMALMKQKTEPLESPIKVMESLLVGFEGVSREDQSGPVMQNTQQLYAGLTYGKGTLNESFLNLKDLSRGYKA